MVTIYSTLGEEAIVHGINETEVSVVITSHDLLPKFKTILKSTPKVKIIIYMEDQLSTTDTSGLRDDVKVYAFNEVVKKGETLNIGKWLYYFVYCYSDNVINSVKHGERSFILKNIVNWLCNFVIWWAK